MENQITGGLRYRDSEYVTKNVTWPFAKIRVTESDIEIDVWNFGDRKIRIEKDRITKIKKRIGFLCCGSEIEHSSPEGPEFICFWTLGYAYEKYAKLFESNGYKVDRKGKMIL